MIDMKFKYCLLSLLLTTGSVASQNPCGSLTGLSDDPLLRGLQQSLGLIKESSRFSRCIREFEAAERYLKEDATYFSKDLVLDQIYRIEQDSLSVGATFLDFQSRTLQKGMAVQENVDPTLRIDMLKNGGFESIGVFAD